MKYLILSILLLWCGTAEASWRMNPFSGKQDFYLGGGAGDDGYFGNLTTYGTSERISGNTYGNYFDFNDEGNGVIVVDPTIALNNTTVPTSPTDVGVKGQIAYDGTYWYVCVATDTWMRTQLSTWSVTQNFIITPGGDFILTVGGDNLVK